MGTKEKRKILEHLKKYNVITIEISKEFYGVKRLNERINELRNDGYKIQTITRKFIKECGKEINHTIHELLEVFE